MSIFGAVVGAVVGGAIGGPIGVVIGGGLGGGLGAAARRRTYDEEHERMKQGAFARQQYLWKINPGNPSNPNGYYQRQIRR